MNNDLFWSIIRQIDEELLDIFHIEYICFGDFHHNTEARFIGIGKKVKVYFTEKSIVLKGIPYEVIEKIANSCMGGSRYIYGDYPTGYLNSVIDEISKIIRGFEVTAWALDDRGENCSAYNFGARLLIVDPQKYADWVGKHGSRDYFELVVKHLFQNDDAFRSIEYFDINKWTIYIEDECNKVLEKYIENNLSTTVWNISYLSSLKLEGETVKSKIYFIEDNMDLLEKSLVVKLKKPLLITLENMRLIRKLLEVANQELPLIATGNTIYGLGLSSNNDGYALIFKGFMHWELLKKDRILVIHKNGRCIFYNHRLENEYYKELIRRYIPGDSDLASIFNIISEAVTQKHGTSILIMEDANIETERLCLANRGIPIEKVCLSNNLHIIKKMTSIDGAILLDLHCNCWGIGIILDGNAIVCGNNGRGARYNSVYNYIAGKKGCNKICIGAIISEDGMVDIIDSSNIPDTDFLSQNQASKQLPL